MAGLEKNSIYIHIPFCKQKCFYCNFVSFTDESQVDLYVEKLISEINFRLESADRFYLESIYIGGGTPPILGIDNLQKILDTVKSFTLVDNQTEITMETNPGIVNKDFYMRLGALGINRISIGAQSFNDKTLKALNRVHTKGQIKEVVGFCNAAGIDNLSVDLMYGLPYQTLKEWEVSLEEAVFLNVKHISAYGLKIEDNTYFGDNHPANLPDEELCSEMYIFTDKLLKKHGFKHYEISNYSKEGYESKHNLRYWKNENYFGCGLSSHGYINGVRYSNSEVMSEYLDNPLSCGFKTELTSENIIEEAVFLGLRLINGIDLVEFKNKYNYDLYESKRELINKYTDNDYMSLNNETLALTQNGFLVSNLIFSEFLF